MQTSRNPGNSRMSYHRTRKSPNVEAGGDGGGGGCGHRPVAGCLSG